MKLHKVIREGEYGDAVAFMKLIHLLQKMGALKNVRRMSINKIHHSSPINIFGVLDPVDHMVDKSVAELEFIVAD